MELKKNRHAVGQSAYHFVWRPKYNIAVFKKDYPRIVIEKAIRDMAERHKIKIVELKVLPDHVHCFVEIPHTISVSMALQYLKGGSARIFFKHCTLWHMVLSRQGQRKPHLWSPGKFYRSVGSVRADVVENYIKYSQGEWNVDFEELK